MRQFKLLNTAWLLHTTCQAEVLPNLYDHLTLGSAQLLPLRCRFADMPPVDAAVLCQGFVPVPNDVRILG